MNAPKEDWLERWHLTPSTHQDFNLIDGLRGIAILMVVTLHLTYINPDSTSTILWTIFALTQTGHIGVDIFFTLSGFLISIQFWRWKVKGRPGVIPTGYAGRRFYKIYPPLALTVIVFGLASWVAYRAPSFLPLTLQWLVGLPLVMPVSRDLNPVMWSLIVEAQFYFTLPLVFICVRRLPVDTAIWSVFTILFGVGIGSLLLYQHLGIWATLYPRIVCPYPNFLQYFSFGALLAGFVAYWGRLPPRWVWLGHLGVVLLLAVVGLLAWLNLHPTHRSYGLDMAIELVVPMVSALLVCYIADKAHPVSHFLCQRWLRWIGLVSYEWYLLHQPLYRLTHAALGASDGNVLHYIAVVGGSFFGSLFLAGMLYRYFSLPILRYGRERHSMSRAPFLKR